MIDYKDIFANHGITPPTELVIVSKKELNSVSNSFESRWGKNNNINYRHLAAFCCSVHPGSSGLRIFDHEKFISSFNLQVDCSKLHPDFFYTLNLYSDIKKSKYYFSFVWLTFEIDSSRDDFEKFCALFSPGYHMQKLFSANTNDKTICSMVDYFGEAWDKSFGKNPTTTFLAELYEYVKQEQNKQQGVA